MPSDSTRLVNCIINENTHTHSNLKFCLNSKVFLLSDPSDDLRTVKASIHTKFSVGQKRFSNKEV